MQQYAICWLYLLYCYFLSLDLGVIQLRDGELCFISGCHDNETEAFWTWTFCTRHHLGCDNLQYKCTTEMHLRCKMTLKKNYTKLYFANFTDRDWCFVAASKKKLWNSLPPGLRQTDLSFEQCKHHCQKKFTFKCEIMSLHYDQLAQHGPNLHSTRVIPKVSNLDISDNYIFHNLYISETYILYEL